MGGESFFDKLKSILGMGQQPPPPAPAGPEGKPWEDPVLAPPGMHRMPSGEMMSNSAMPSPPPTPPGSIADDPYAQAVKLMKQREIAKRMIPEGAWNR